METRETRTSKPEPTTALPSLSEIGAMQYDDLHRVVSAVRSNTNWTTPQHLMGSGGTTKYAEKRHAPNA